MATIAFVGAIWGFPLGTVLDRLLARDYSELFAYSPDGELREHLPENGHAAAAVVIAAAIIEAHVRRAMLRHDGPSSAAANDVAAMLSELLRLGEAVSSDLADEVGELLHVRNAILHSHEWIIQRGRWRTDRTMGRRLRVVAERLVGRGALGTTDIDRMPRTGLNRIPTWVDVPDVLVALALAVEVTDQLERRGFRADSVIILLGGRPLPLAKAALDFEAAVEARDNPHMQ